MPSQEVDKLISKFEGMIASYSPTNLPCVIFHSSDRAIYAKIPVTGINISTPSIIEISITNRSTIIYDKQFCKNSRNKQENEDYHFLLNYVSDKFERLRNTSEKERQKKKKDLVDEFWKD